MTDLNPTEPEVIATDSADQEAGEAKQEAIEENLAQAAEDKPGETIMGRLARIESKIDTLLTGM